MMAFYHVSMVSLTFFACVLCPRMELVKKGPFRYMATFYLGGGGIERIKGSQISGTHLLYDV